MPVFELEANGKSYEIEAPTQAAALSAFQGFSSKASARPQASQPQYDAMGNAMGGSESFDAPVAGPSPVRDQVNDIAKGIGGGLVRGAAGTVGLVTDTLPTWVKGGSDYLARKITGQTEEQQQAEQRDFAASLPQALSRTAGGIVNAGKTENLQRGIESVTGEAYEPTTRAGKIASRAAEFIPGAVAPGLAMGRLGTLGREAVAWGAIPGATSEVAGQVFEGGALETPARIAGGLAGGIGAAAAMRGGTGGNMVRQAIDGATPQQIDAAEQLFQRAQQAGQPISRAEALQSVTGGTTGLGDLQHTVEGLGGMKQFYAQRPAQNEAAARRVFDEVVPQAADPSQIGPTVGGVAQQAMRESPVGRILDDTLFQAGPRVTPEQAGTTMQQELRGVYDRREGMRSALADRDYTAARQAGVPVPTANVDSFIERELQTAKGETLRALQQARQTLYRPDGSLDASVTGLHNARGAITDLIDQATRSGANNTARELGATLSRLDDALESVPAYGQARRNFRAASQPLEPFDQTRAPGRIIERDQYGQRNVMPADRVPQAIQQGGPSAARDFNAVATPAAREAFEQNIVTQVLDKATREGTDLSADSIRQALRQNEDVLRQYPGVRDRLESVAIAREGLARLEGTPLGKLAQRDQTTRAAVDALFPQNPAPGSAGEIADAIGTLAQRNSWAARQLVRTHAESMFNEASQRLAAGPNQSGGAKFAAQIRGNPQQAENLEAAVKALPNGDSTWRGFNSFLDILEAQQFRQPAGSRTAFKAPGVEDMKTGGLANGAAQLVATGGFAWPKKALAAVQNWNVGRNLDDLSRLLTDPAAANDFRAIATAPAGSNKALALTARLAIVAGNGREADRPRVRITQNSGGR